MTFMNYGCFGDLYSFQQWWTGHLIIKLFVNDHIPTPADTAADYVEASFPGYANGGIYWNAPVQDSQGATMTGGPNTFTTTAASSQLLYGYYVTDSADNVWFAERDPSAPISLNAAGIVYTITSVLVCRPGTFS